VQQYQQKPSELLQPSATDQKAIASNAAEFAANTTKNLEAQLRAKIKQAEDQEKQINQFVPQAYRSYPVNSAHTHIKELHEKLANLTGDHSYLTAQWAKENREVAEKAVEDAPAGANAVEVGLKADQVQTVEQLREWRERLDAQERAKAEAKEHERSDQEKMIKQFVPESYRASALKYFDEQVKNGTSASAAALRATALAAKEGPQEPSAHATGLAPVWIPVGCFAIGYVLAYGTLLARRATRMQQEVPLLGSQPEAPLLG